MALINEGCEEGTQISQMLVSGQLGIGDIVDRPNLNYSALLGKKRTIDGYREEGCGRKRFPYFRQGPSIKSDGRPNLIWLICFGDRRLETAFICEPVNL